MTRGDLCQVSVERNDYVWLSDAAAPLLTAEGNFIAVNRALTPEK